jgi:hypothetical protein
MDYLHKKQKSQALGLALGQSLGAGRGLSRLVQIGGQDQIENDGQHRRWEQTAGHQDPSRVWQVLQ